ncbi:hypothetical protein AOQ84DRAFT_392120 [Glonium stellatum]|uniref:Uncharacterized protein n=1 Tax=Glonium stellatum TaxID=574774 RepID=A0A8E2ERS4_9PEZI|nr:hypothetical protein AOQ84DRAFT_392120 [Glonium stellatum]
MPTYPPLIKDHPSLQAQPLPSPTLHPIDPQPQCCLLSLPAELRNSIYSSVFNTTSSTPNALALLQSCRLIYTEASLLAFSTCTFVTHLSVRYHLSQRTRILPPAQFAAITHLALTGARDNDATTHATFLANAISLFPGLRTATLLLASPSRYVYLADPPYPPSQFPKQAPGWVGNVLFVFLSGRPLAWPKAEPWSVEWRYVSGTARKGNFLREKIPRQSAFFVRGLYQVNVAGHKRPCRDTLQRMYSWNSGPLVIEQEEGSKDGYNDQGPQRPWAMIES